MDVQVKDGLASRLVSVGNEPETVVRHPALTGDLGGHAHHPAYQSVILFLQVQDTSDMLLGNQQQVLRSLWIYILDYYQLLVVIDCLGRDYPGTNLTENALFHGGFLFAWSLPPIISASR
jgi:hypothetical protein